MQSPLVSCILPTKNRERLIPLAIRSFLSQTYARKELVVIDNGDDGTHDVLLSLIDPTLLGRYHHVTGEKTTGEMRNLAVEASNGDIICHFDSDDWSAPTRVADQVARLQGYEPYEFTGYKTMWFYDEQSRQTYFWSLPTLPFAIGTSFCYRRSWWQAHPFEHVRVGEDMGFFNKVKSSRVRYTTPDVGQQMVALIHSAQTSRKATASPQYNKAEMSQLPEGFLCALISLPIYLQAGACGRTQTY